MRCNLTLFAANLVQVFGSAGAARHKVLKIDQLGDLSPAAVHRYFRLHDNGVQTLYARHVWDFAIVWGVAPILAALEECEGRVDWCEDGF